MDIERRIDIGVLEESDNKILHPRFFPSKVGGKPAWLNLNDLPKPSQLTCNLCKDPLIFLCQVYAPIELSNSDDGFHRTLFIFVCRNGACCRQNLSENFVVLRCQLPRQNEFYSYEPYDGNVDEAFPIDKWSKLCEVCGCLALSHCSKCKTTHYCSRNHQVLDWKKGHKEICSTEQAGKDNSFTVTQSGKGLLFKEWEIIVDEEDEEDSEQVDEAAEMSKMLKLMQEKKAGTLSNVSESELEQYTKEMPEDKVFNKFSKRVSRHPDQILRYERGGNPLWITSAGDNSLINIPKCEYCNEERQFEFQIMPQLLNFIDVGIELNSIDWGVLVIYTCRSSCSEGPAYKKEVLIKQDLSQ